MCYAGMSQDQRGPTSVEREQAKRQRELSMGPQANPHADTKASRIKPLGGWLRKEDGRERSHGDRRMGRAGDNHITTGITEGFILRFQSHLSFSSAILHDSTIFQAP
uniref:Uncharacterized protein n=1 Tax=Bionectria ochroleuca TaxID=29856 RepID=A0A8H7NE33_BIOOC